MKNFTKLIFALIAGVAEAQMPMQGAPQMQGQFQGGAQFQMGGQQSLGGQPMMAPNQGMAMNPGAYQGSFQGNGDIPAHAIQGNHLCNTGRFADSRNFNFGPGGQGPGMPGSHQ